MNRVLVLAGLLLGDGSFSQAGPVSQIAVSPDGHTWASAGEGNTLRLWGHQGSPLKTVNGHLAAVTGIAFRSDSAQVATSSLDGTIRIWAASGQWLSTLSGHADGVNSVAFPPGITALVSGGCDGTVRLWDLVHDSHQIIGRHQGPVLHVAASADGKLIASSGTDGLVKLWQREGPLKATLAGHGDWVWGVAFSPDGKWLASVGKDQTVFMWDLEGRLIQSFSSGSSGRLLDVQFSPDSKRLAAGAADGSVTLWDLSGQAIATYPEPGHRALSVAFSRQGLLAGYEDGTVRIFPLNESNAATRSGAVVQPPDLPELPEKPLPQPDKPVPSIRPSATPPPIMPSPAPQQAAPSIQVADSGGGAALFPQARVRKGLHVVDRNVLAPGSGSFLFGAEVDNSDNGFLETGLFYYGIVPLGSGSIQHAAGYTAKAQVWKATSELPLSLAIGGYQNLWGLVSDLIQGQAPQQTYVALFVAAEYDPWEDWSLRAALQTGGAGLGATWHAPWIGAHASVDVMLPFQPFIPGTFGWQGVLRPVGAQVGWPAIGFSFGL